MQNMCSNFFWSTVQIPNKKHSPFEFRSISFEIQDLLVGVVLRVWNFLHQIAVTGVASENGRKIQVRICNSLSHYDDYGRIKNGSSNICDCTITQSESRGRCYITAFRSLALPHPNCLIHPLLGLSVLLRSIMVSLWSIFYD